ncbi:hypothetical protein EBZ57_02225 [bacterium]|nr:hypothetical protein [bacterium]
MANKIILNPEGYVEVIMDGDQTFMTIDNMKYDAIDMLNTLQKEGKPRLGLVDLTKQTNYTADTNKAAMKNLEALNYEKVALFGASTLLTEVTKAIILAMGRSHNTQIFKDRESAVSWLLDNPAT